MKNLKNFKALVTLCILRGASVWHFEIDVPFSKFLIELLGEVVEDSKWEENADRMCYNKIERTDYGFAVSFYDIQDTWNGGADLYYYKQKRVLEYRTFNNFWYIFKEGTTGGTVLEFCGPRAAFAKQTIIPETIKNILSWDDCVGMWDANGIYWDFQEVKDFYRKVDGYDFWKTSNSKEETPIIKTSSKRFMSHEEGKFNEPKWDHCYCSHYAKGKTMRSHRNPKAIRTSGHLHKELPEWLWRRMVREGEW